MASIKVVLYTNRTNKKGEHPVRLQVIHKRKRVIKTLFNLHAEFWDENKEEVLKGHSDATYLNEIISGEKQACLRKQRKFEDARISYNAEDLFDPIDQQTPFLEVITDFLKGFEHRDKRKYTNLADKIREFDESIKMSRIDKKFVDRFKKWLAAHKRINSEETVHRYIRSLKTVLSDQYRKGNYNNHQVLAYKTSQGLPSQKVALTRDEFKAIVEVKTDMELSRDCFCLMAYLQGIRIGDCLQLTQSNIQLTKSENDADRLIFQEQKTNQKRNMKIREPAQEIIDRYRGQSIHDYILPILMLPPSNPKTDYEFAKHIESRITLINRELKIIAAQAGLYKNISTHVARHTYASFCAQEGLKYTEIQKLLGHRSVRMTENYIKSLLSQDEVDEAGDRVF